MLSLPLVTSLFFVTCTRKADELPPPVAPEMTETTDPTPETLERIEVHTELIDGATHWAPKTITVKAGKKYLVVAKHEIEGGFDFHGLQIQEFGVLAQVNRNKEFTQEIDIPADKKGSFTIGCQFHPAHKSAQLIVE